MKQLILSFLLTAILAVVPNLGIYAQSDCDILFDFETAQNPTIGTLTYEGVTNSGATSTNTSVSISGDALKIINNGDYNHGYVKLTVTLPEGKTMADYNSPLALDISFLSGDILHKDFKYAVNTNSTIDFFKTENASGVFNKTIDLSSVLPTATSFYILLGAQWRSGATFSVDNIKLAADPDKCVTIAPTEDARLSDLTISGTTISGFSKAKEEYTIEVANDVDKITIGATVNEEGATFSPAAVGEKALKLGLNTFSITVTSSNNTATKTYTINVIRKDVVCDVVFDFENDALGANDTYKNGSSKDMKIQIIQDPKDGTKKALQFKLDYNGSEYVFFQLPDGKSLADFKTLQFDLLTNQSSPENNKQIVIGISPNGVDLPSTKYQSGNENINGTDAGWKTYTYSINDNLSDIKDSEGSYIGIGINNDSRLYCLDNVTLIANDGACPKTYTWTPVSNSTDWTVATNWTPNGVPGSSVEDKVIIPKSSSYPILAADVTINSITFAPEAELTNQNYLTATNGATVQFVLSNTSRLHMLSLPVPAELSDFQFIHKDPAGPLAFLLKFTPKGDVAGWDFINKGNVQGLTIGEAFVAAIGTWDTDYTASISGQLTKNDASVTVTFAKDGPNAENPSYFAHVGNPFIASIDFDALYKANSNKDVIKNNYLVWTGEGFAGYTALGDFGVGDISEFIAPLQSFYVERKDGVTSATASLSFPLSITNNASGKGTLRSFTSESFGKLDIVANNGTVPVKAFIANKEGAESARKLKTGCGDIPDVYTLGDDNATALGANIINTDNAISVPLAIATKTAGNMRLTFSGMSSFDDVNITLIDNITGETTPLTGDSYPYEFDYTPPTNDNGEVIANESRFAIAFSPKSVTSLDGTLKESLSVYAKNNVIHVISSSADPIRQISVWDMQGRMFLIEDNLNTSVFTLNGLQFNAADIYIVKVITEKGVKNVKVINK